MSRPYTVQEIDELRNACSARWLFGTTAPSGNHNRTHVFRDRERVACVEEMVRTHMLAGHTAEDIYAADLEKRHPGEVS